MLALLSGCAGRYVCFPVKNCKATYRIYYYAGYVDSTAQKPIGKEFEYLKGDIPPPTWLRWTSVILAILLGVGTSYFFHNFDLDEVCRQQFSRNRSNRFNRY